MRENLPSREFRDLRPVPGNVGFPERWARSVNRACTAWLMERGLLGSLMEEYRPFSESINQDRESNAGRNPGDAATVVAGVNDAGADADGPGSLTPATAYASATTDLLPEEAV